MIGERVIILSCADGLPELMRLERLITVKQGRAGVTASVIGLAQPLTIADGLPSAEAAALFGALLEWISGRGGSVFDVAAWRREHDELARAAGGRPNRPTRRTA